MELIADDIQEYIFSFLSLKEKRNATEVCRTFKRNIKSNSILIPQMNAMIERNFMVDIRQGMEMMLITDQMYIPYREANLRTNVHPLYRQHRYNMKEKCIVERCKERRLGYIYTRIMETGDITDEHYYTKRSIPYCVQCFNIWGRGGL